MRGPDWRRSLLIAGAALTMVWPALYNGYPLLYPDSMSYLQDGGRVARAVFLREPSSWYGGRSFIYCLGILPFHWNVTPWPIVGLHAGLTAYVLWLVVRCVLPTGRLVAYGILIGVLSLMTTLPWFVSFVMPDVLGPVLYLCIYLVAFEWDALSRGERAAIVLVAWWSAASHVTHLLLGSVLCLAVLVVGRLQREPARRWISAAARPAAIVLVAALAHLALHAFLYGGPSLAGEPPPFLLARVTADGPGRWYLERHCPALHAVICEDVGRLPDNVADFLWAPGGIWQSASTERQARLREEEMRIVAGTIRRYPGAVLRIAASHVLRQLRSFGLWNYDAAPWILEMFETVLPGERGTYLRSRQAHGALHEGAFSAVEEGAVLISLVAIVGCGAALRRRWPPRLAALTAIVVLAVIGNATITGALSNVEDRYQGRVVWMLPLLAGLLALYRWRSARAPDSRPVPR